MAGLPFAKTIVKRLADELRPRGFRRTGQTFIQPVNDCFQIVNLQASAFGTRDDQRYTLNLAVYSNLLQPLTKEPQRLKAYEGHWGARIGQFTDERQDKWWIVRNDEDALRAGNEMVALLPVALEAMGGISDYRAVLNIPPGAGASSDDPPGSCLWNSINEGRAREGLPPSVGFTYVEGWRNSWSRRHFPGENLGP